MPAGVHDAVGECAVIGEQQQALGILVQTANGVDTLLHILQQIHDTTAIQFVRGRRHIASGLVQHEIAVGFLSWQVDTLAVDRDQIGSCRLVPQLDRMAVYFDFSAGDQLLRLTAGTVSCICQQFLDSDFFHIKLLFLKK